MTGNGPNLCGRFRFRKADEVPISVIDHRRDFFLSRSSVGRNEDGEAELGWDRPLKIGRDRLIVAVGPGTSQSITIDLAKALSSLRAQATALLPAKQRAALRTLSATLKGAWKAVTGKNATDADIAAILPLIAVMRFDMAGPDRRANSR